MMEVYYRECLNCRPMFEAPGKTSGTLVSCKNDVMRTCYWDL